MAAGGGGVIIASDGSVTTLGGGVFENNKALLGGVCIISAGASVQIEDGVFEANAARGEDDAGSVDDEGPIQVGGGVLTILISYIQRHAKHFGFGICSMRLES